MIVTMMREAAGAPVFRLLLAVATVVVLLNACTGLPDNVEPVDDFELDRYLGKWFEIARLDHRFERGLSRVTAEYSLRGDGSVKVVNRGYHDNKDEWREAEGTARFVGDSDRGYLKVSFFGPFYGSYVIMELDRDGYAYSMVSGPDRDYLWILAREPRLDPATLKSLVERAASLGYSTADLIYVVHD